MTEATTTTRKQRTAKPPALDKAIAALSAALSDPDHPEHQAAVEYVDENFARQAEAAIPEGQRPRNIVEALVAVMREVRAVGKDGRNTQGQGYDFRGIDGTINALGPAMRKVGVIPMPTVKTHQYGEVTVGQNRTKQAHSRVEVEYTFYYSNKDGVMSNLTAYVPGEAMDSGDKATAKSMSVAFRTCLLQTFAVPTHDRDPDEDTYERSPAPEPVPAAALKEACVKASSQDDIRAAFERMREFYGDRLAVSTAATHEGETLPGDEYLNYAEQVAIQWRAERDAEAAAREKGLAEQKEAQEGSDEQPAEQQPEQPQEGREVAPDQPAEQQPPAEQPQEQRKAPEPGKSRQQVQRERLLTCAKEELIFQAEVAKVPPADFGASILGEPGDLDSIIPAKAPRFLVGNRPRVIHILRERGDATVAEAYESIGQGFPILVSDITGQR